MPNNFFFLFYRLGYSEVRRILIWTTGQRSVGDRAWNQSLRTTWPSLTRRQLRGEESLTKSEGTDFRPGSSRFGKVSNLASKNSKIETFQDTSRCGLCLSINWISQESYERVQSSVGLGSVSLLNQISQRTRNNLGGFQDKWEPVMLKKLIQLR